MQKKPHNSIIHGLRTALGPLVPARKYLNLIIILLLGVLGYLVGPKDMQLGNYTAKIVVTLADQTLSVAYPFELGTEAGEPVVDTQMAGQYQIIFAAQDTYKYGLDQRISYRLRVLDSAGQPVHLSLENANSTISGEGYRQFLPPTDNSGEWFEFTMRVPYKAQICSALVFAVGMLWLTELVPLAAASLLIPVVIVVAGVTDPNTVLQPFFHPIVVLFFAGFLLAEGMRRTGVDRIVALTILKSTSLKPAYLMFTMIGLAAFLSMWMSNTASVAILIPIALAVLEKIPGDHQRTGFRRALILGIAYAATVGGIGSAIGTPANILAMTFLSEFAGTHLAFIDWFAYGLPVVLIMVPIIWLYLTLVFRVQFHEIGPHLSHEVYNNELKEMGGLNRDQRLLVWVFMAIMSLWLTDRWHHVHTSIVALGGVIVLFFTGTIKKKDFSQINWDALLTFGGGLALGNMLIMTGVSDWIALLLTRSINFPPLLVVLFIAGFTLLIGAFISNTACAAMLIPLAIPLANNLHLDPRLLVTVIAIASSIDFALVVGTPPTMMAYSTGFFDTKEIFKRGVVLDLIGILILSFGVIWIWKWLGVVTL